MKKILFGLLVALTTLSAYGQKPDELPSVLITRNTSTQRMVWSDVDDEYMFFDLKDRYRDINVWLSYFNDNGTGYIQMIREYNNEFIELNVYNYEIKEDAEGTYLKVQAIQSKDGQKVTVIIQDYGDGLKMVTVFMPLDQLAIYFDTERN